MLGGYSATGWDPATSRFPYFRGAAGTSTSSAVQEPALLRNRQYEGTLHDKINTKEVVMVSKHLILLTIAAFATFWTIGQLGPISPTEASGDQADMHSFSPNTLKRFSGTTIYFGHQSVGSNIMEGVKNLILRFPQIQLEVIELDDPSLMKPGLFAHGSIGENWHPIKKIEDFESKMNAGLAKTVDIAFFKFCYIDMMADQDAVAVFEKYRETMARLREAYPDTRFVHVTIPLTVAQTGPKAVIKKLINRAPGGYLDNIKRNEYNRMLLATYEGKEPVFDLARVEATRPDGSIATFEWKGQSYYRLVPEYASDGRHLNETGRQHTAEKLLTLLATVETPSNLAAGKAESAEN